MSHTGVYVRRLKRNPRSILGRSLSVSSTNKITIRSEDPIPEPWDNTCDRESGVHRFEVLGVQLEFHLKEQWYNIGAGTPQAAQHPLMLDTTS